MCSETSEKVMRVKSVVIAEKDNVATVLDEVRKDSVVDVCNKKNEHLYQVNALEAIPKGNKIALKGFEVGESVIKYKNVIGIATKKLKKVL